MNIIVKTVLHAGTSGCVDLPISSWSEVSEWYVKWDILHYRLKVDGTWHEVELYSDSLDIIDWKRPISIEIIESDENWEHSGKILDGTE